MPTAQIYKVSVEHSEMAGTWDNFFLVVPTVYNIEGAIVVDIDNMRATANEIDDDLIDADILSDKADHLSRLATVVRHAAAIDIPEGQNYRQEVEVADVVIGRITITQFTAITK